MDECQIPVSRKYFLYENSVQSPKEDMAWLARSYYGAFKREALRMREDFCGTFRLSSEWVKQGPKKTALCLDLDNEPLSYGRRVHLKRLSPNQRRRIRILKQDVRSVTRPLSDVIAGFNFSFFIFKKRRELLKYLKACYRSLARPGMVVLEMAGGPGMVERAREQRTFKRGSQKWFTYYWDQKRFNPITHDAFYAIHFKFPDGKIAKDVFTYDWRVWTIPEVRDVMADAGFEETKVYWEHELRDGSSDFRPIEKGDNPWAWTAYVAGLKK